jgi:hypothetical protein
MNPEPEDIAAEPEDIAAKDLKFGFSVMGLLILAALIVTILS